MNYLTNKRNQKISGISGMKNRSYTKKIHTDRQRNLLTQILEIRDKKSLYMLNSNIWQIAYLVTHVDRN